MTDESRYCRACETTDYGIEPHTCGEQLAQIITAIERGEHQAGGAG